MPCLGAVHRRHNRPPRSHRGGTCHLGSSVQTTVPLVFMPAAPLSDLRCRANIVANQILPIYDALPYLHDAARSPSHNYAVSGSV